MKSECRRPGASISLLHGCAEGEYLDNPKAGDKTQRYCLLVTAILFLCDYRTEILIANILQSL